MSRALYQISADFEAVLGLADSGDPEDQQAFIDTLESLTGELEDKLISCAAVVKQLEGIVVLLKSEEDRLSARKKTVGSNIDSLKAYMKRSMESAGITKVKRPTFEVAIQNSPPSVAMDEGTYAENLPEEFRRVKIDIDRTAVSEALKSGRELGFAKLVRCTHLRIR